MFNKYVSRRSINQSMYIVKIMHAMRISSSKKFLVVVNNVYTEVSLGRTSGFPVKNASFLDNLGSERLELFLKLRRSPDAVFTFTLFLSFRPKDAALDKNLGSFFSFLSETLGKLETD